MRNSVHIPRFRDAGQLTLIDLHVRDGLPLVHRHEPLWTLAIILPAAAQVDDQLARVAAQRREDGVQAWLAEVCIREEEGRYDDLLIPHSHPSAPALSIISYACP